MLPSILDNDHVDEEFLIKINVLLDNVDQIYNLRHYRV